MYSVEINGKTYTSEADKKLLRFLRDDLHLTAAKDGCSEGVCGTCTVLVDGKKTKACTVPLSRLEGRKILTVEGIDPEEMRVYEHCFAEAGAVQCGFCIPGMIISAKSLLDETLTPSRTDVKKAIRGNLCRCTGYKKIEDAILLAADFFREKRQIPENPKELHMDERFRRIDAAAKVNGSGIFCDDIYLDGMIYAKGVYSRYPRARIDRIDVSRAEAHPDCVRVLLKKDVPCNIIGHLKYDWDVMMGEGDITKYVGNVLAVVASRARGITKVRGAAQLRTKECDRISDTLHELAKLGVKYEEYPDGFDIMGLSPDAKSSEYPASSEALIHLDAHGDHRLAMSLGVAACICRRPVELTGAGLVGISFPNFWTILREARVLR